MKTADEQTVFDMREKRIYVESLDGEAYGGETFGEVVAEMRRTAWGGEASDGIRGYMKQVAKRIWDWSRRQIRVHTPEAFLRDMEREGLLKLRVRGEGDK